jgi:hypothetical protein
MANMTGPDHYQAAQNVLRMADNHLAESDAPGDYQHALYLIAKAQVHATLAHAAAVATTIPNEGTSGEDNSHIIRAWSEVGAW